MPTSSSVRTARPAEQGGAIAGFSVPLEPTGDACGLDRLFVEPDRMRTGVGRRLIDDAKRLARERGARRIDVVANPQAVAFHAAVGSSRPARRTPGWGRRAHVTARALGRGALHRTVCLKSHAKMSRSAMESPLRRILSFARRP